MSEYIVVKKEISCNLSTAGVKKFCEKALGLLGEGKGELGVVITGNKQIRALNQKYRGKNESTNVLSFEAREGNSLGDIIISWEYAKSEASELGISTKERVRALLIHGIVHLLGYDHLNKKSEQKMESLEKELQEKLFSIKI